jgi:hypothetical protein
MKTWGWPQTCPTITQIQEAIGASGKGTPLAVTWLDGTQGQEPGQYVTYVQVGLERPRLRRQNGTWVRTIATSVSTHRMFLITDCVPEVF